MKTKSEYAYVLYHAKKIKAVNLFGGKCEQCGEDRPWILTFHHKDPNEKEFKIGELLSLRWSKLKNEVLKCRLLCHNCHRKIHNQNNITKDVISKQLLLEYKNIKGCQECSYDKCNGSLSFHHRNSKEKMFELSTKRIKTFDDLDLYIKDELDKCDVLCQNCHADLHFDEDRFEKYKDEIMEKVNNYRETQDPISHEIIKQLLSEGKTQIEIARLFGRNKSTISCIMKRHNLK